MTEKRVPLAELTNSERPEGDRPPIEPASSPKLRVLPEGYFLGSVGGHVARLEAENAALRAEVERLRGLLGVPK